MQGINQPAFSIITPTFLRPTLLRRNIISVANQTFKDYEHIIVDDSNDPETEHIVNSFKDKRIKFYRNQSSKGAAGSYNTGIKESIGNYILFLDDDDEYLPTLLEKMHDRFLEADQNVGFIWAGISRILDNENGEKIMFSKIWPYKFLNAEKGLCEATSIGNGFGVCVRKICIDSIGLYDESLVIGEDTDFLFRLAMNFDFETIPEALVKIHMHSDHQLTGAQNFLKQIEAKELILSRYSEFMTLHPYLYFTHEKAYADYCYKFNRKKKGRKALLSIIRNTPFRILGFADLIFYELTGKDTANFYNISGIRTIVHFLKGNRNNAD